MAIIDQKTILARKSGHDFVGRAVELSRLLEHSGISGRSAGLMVSSPPLVGTSELLRQAFDSIYRSDGGVIPVYFSFERSDDDLNGAGRRFFREFLSQVAAYRRRDTALLFTSPGIEEVSRFAALQDGYWIDSAIEAFNRTSANDDEKSVLNSCFGAPMRAAMSGVGLFVMLDGLHNIRHLSGRDVAFELSEMYRNVEMPFVLAGRRRYFTGDLGCQQMSLEPLSFTGKGLLIERNAVALGIDINESTRDLIARQFGDQPLFVEAICRRAMRDGVNLDSYRMVETAYASELFGGVMGGFFDDCISSAVPLTSFEKSIAGLLHDAANAGKKPLPVEFWQKRSGLNDAEFSHAVGILNDCEIINASSNRIELAHENTIFKDHISIRHRLETTGTNRALVFAESLAAFVKRAPAIMAELYRRNSTLGLREVMRQFDGQPIPAILLDYGKYKLTAKGVSDAEVGAIISDVADAVTLPNVVFTVNAEEVYPEIGKISEKERAAVAVGFLEGDSGGESEIAWIAAEIDEMFEVDGETAGFWCDRLEMAALMCGFQKFKLWLVSKEGFSFDALEILAARNCFSSSRRQAELLIDLLDPKADTEVEPEMTEYEIVMPMSAEAELIAAHTLEEIARSHDLDTKSINQVKTALVEACINAAEHGSSPDGRIHQRFRVGSGRIEVTVSNRGIRLADRDVVEISPVEGRRGWGLKLMKRLMDEVVIQRVDDGTSIFMTKRFATQGNI